MCETKQIPIAIYFFKRAINEGRMELSDADYRSACEAIMEDGTLKDHIRSKKMMRKLNQIAVDEYSHEVLYSDWEIETIAYEETTNFLFDAIYRETKSLCYPYKKKIDMVRDDILAAFSLPKLSGKGWFDFSDCLRSILKMLIITIQYQLTEENVLKCLSRIQDAIDTQKKQYKKRSRTNTSDMFGFAYYFYEDSDINNFGHIKWLDENEKMGVAKGLYQYIKNNPAYEETEIYSSEVIIEILQKAVDIARVARVDKRIDD